VQQKAPVNIAAGAFLHSMGQRPKFCALPGAELRPCLVTESSDIWYILTL
jgi:hypothetical protein